MEVFEAALPALGQAWAMILQPEVLGYLLGGVVMGLAVGVFPGLGGIAGLSLVLPFMFGMEPVYGLALMIGMLAVVPTSDTFASVLMGIPGSSASQATVLDGFPLAKRASRTCFVSGFCVISVWRFGGGLLFNGLYFDRASHRSGLWSARNVDDYGAGLIDGRGFGWPVSSERARRGRLGHHGWNHRRGRCGR